MGQFHSMLRRLPPSVYGEVLTRLGRHSSFYPFGFAMNGQTSRLEATRQIFYNCGIRRVIETGTFHGTTTEWFARLGVPVQTIEADPYAFEFSQRRLSKFANVHVLKGSSVTKLAEVLATDSQLPTLIYLDAHWEDHLPLAEELAIINKQAGSFVVIIDDFQVPGDEGYEFDDYGAGKALVAAYVEPFVQKGSSIYYPATPASQETGRKRGWVVLSSPDMVPALDLSNLIRRAA